MSHSDLRHLLTQLHARLGDTRSLDVEDRRLLATVLADIEHALEKGGDAGPAIGVGLESLAVRFEAGHPALTQTIRSIADSLGKAGI